MCTGIPQILTQVDRLSKHRDFFVKALFFMFGSLQFCGPWARTRSSLNLPGCGCGSSPRPHRAAVGRLQRLKERKKVALPPTLPACLLSLQGLKGDGLSHRTWRNQEQFLSISPWNEFSRYGLKYTQTLFCFVVFSQTVLTVDGLSKRLSHSCVSSHLCFSFFSFLPLSPPTGMVFCIEATTSRNNLKGFKPPACQYHHRKDEMTG